MTETEIDAMQAGPELDALACEAAGIEPKISPERLICKVCGKQMGLDSWQCIAHGSYRLADIPLFPPVSADAAAALQAAHDFSVRHQTFVALEWAPGGGCRCVIAPSRPTEPFCASVPLAIARALAKHGLRLKRRDAADQLRAMPAQGVGAGWSK